MREFTLIVPYYRQPIMLRRQLVEWRRYPPAVRVIVIDDGSPEPADDALPNDCRAQIYRIDEDTPWNRNGARNLGAHVAETDWIVQVDIDHVLLDASARRLLEMGFEPDPEKWYRFARYRVGKADETRRKDAIPEDADFGEIKPHIDSYLIARDLYWSVGGYDEDYSGSLGGSAPFLKALNLAVLLGVARILLLGFDLDFSPDGERHWHGNHPPGLNNPEYHLFRNWRQAFASALPDLHRAGVEVVNCSRRTALACFPRLAIEEALR